jgi:hypothetical protein
MLATLKSFNWKRHANTLIKVVLDFKVFGLVLLNGLVIYGIGWDTILRPNLESIKSRDEALNEQKKNLSEKEDLQKQYGVWEQQLKDLDAQMIPVPDGNSAKVISVTESSELLSVAQGKERELAILPPLQPPHDERLNVSLTPGASATLDIMKPDGDTSGAQAATPAVPPAGGAPQPPGGEVGGTVEVTSLPVERFDYELKITGTYPALMDVLNELTIRKKLVKINKITITKSASEVEEQPDAKEYPEYPLKLDMVVSLSIFLYTSHGQQS